MADKSTYVLPFRRKREGRTNYHTRLRLLSSQKPRLVVRKSLKHISLQLVKYAQEGDLVLVSAHTKELGGFGWKASTSNIPAAYLCGLLLAKKAGDSGVNEVIADLGSYTNVKGSVLYAALKGVVDGGLSLPFDDSVAPSEDRISGKHIADWAAKLKGDDEDAYKKTFSRYHKQGIKPEDITSHFEDIKKKIEEQ